MVNINKVGNACCGCGACEQICKFNAIKMIATAEGFLYPIIDMDKCTNCGMCAKSCPVLNAQYKNFKKPKSFAVMANDEIRYNSSSGGVFSVLAYYFLKNNGYVAGAIWDKDGSVKHVVSDKKEVVNEMRGSKYLQSEMRDCYLKIKDLLKTQNQVLFTGTPCQIAGLKSFLGKEYDNLFTLEIICHGTPSPKVFRKYLQENLSANEEFIKTNFRDKIQGWSHKHIITTETNLRTFSTKIKEHDFSQAFLKDLCLRKSCGECKFNKLSRQADITMGDFWGVWKYDKNLDDKKGTSIVFLNNKRGEELFNNIKKELKLVAPVPFKKAVKGNPNMLRPTIHNPKREVFMDMVNKKSLKSSLDYCLNNTADCMILNYWYAINYGAALTCYGIQCLAEKIGLSPKIINYIPRFEDTYPNSFSEKFAQKYLKLTEPVNDYEDFVKLNSYCKTFITGSDQVWAPNLTKTHCKGATQSIYLLDFVKNGNKKISCSASFGGLDFRGDYEQETLFRHFLKQFDAISVREDTGLGILKDFGVNGATQILDGAFYIPKEKLEEMTKGYKKEEKYIACFVLPYFKKETWYQKLLIKIEKELNLPVKNFEFNNKTSVEEWLAYIKNSEFVITDSFHGFAFSIIFNRPFVQVKNSKKQSRFESVFRLFNIENNSVGKDDEIDFEKIFIKRDWEKINKKIEEECIKAEKWLSYAVNLPTQDRSCYDVENYLLINSQLSRAEMRRSFRIYTHKRVIKFKLSLATLLKKFAKGKRKKELEEEIKYHKKTLKFVE